MGGRAVGILLSVLLVLAAKAEDAEQGQASQSGESLVAEEAEELLERTTAGPEETVRSEPLTAESLEPLGLADNRGSGLEEDLVDLGLGEDFRDSAGAPLNLETASLGDLGLGQDLDIGAKVGSLVDESGNADWWKIQEAMIEDGVDWDLDIFQRGSVLYERPYLEGQVISRYPTRCVQYKDVLEIHYQVCNTHPKDTQLAFIRPTFTNASPVYEDKNDKEYFMRIDVPATKFKYQPVFSKEDSLALLSFAVEPSFCQKMTFYQQVPRATPEAASIEFRVEEAKPSDKPQFVDKSKSDLSNLGGGVRFCLNLCKGIDIKYELARYNEIIAKIEKYECEELYDFLLQTVTIYNYGCQAVYIHNYFHSSYNLNNPYCEDSLVIKGDLPKLPKPYEDRVFVAADRNVEYAYNYGITTKDCKRVALNALVPPDSQIKISLPILMPQILDLKELIAKKCKPTPSFGDGCFVETLEHDVVVDLPQVSPVEVVTSPSKDYYNRTLKYIRNIAPPQEEQFQLGDLGLIGAYQVDDMKTTFSSFADYQGSSTLVAASYKRQEDEEPELVGQFNVTHELIPIRDVDGSAETTVSEEVYVVRVEACLFDDAPYALPLATLRDSFAAENGLRLIPSTVTVEVVPDLESTCETGDGGLAFLDGIGIDIQPFPDGIGIDVGDLLDLNIVNTAVLQTLNREVGYEAADYAGPFSVEDDGRSIQIDASAVQEFRSKRRVARRGPGQGRQLAELLLDHGVIEGNDFGDTEVVVSATGIDCGDCIVVSYLVAAEYPATSCLFRSEIELEGLCSYQASATSTVEHEYVPDLRSAVTIGDIVDCNENGVTDPNDIIRYDVSLWNTGSITISDIEVANSPQVGLDFLQSNSGFDVCTDDNVADSVTFTVDLLQGLPGEASSTVIPIYARVNSIAATVGFACNAGVEAFFDNPCDCLNCTGNYTDVYACEGRDVCVEVTGSPDLRADLLPSTVNVTEGDIIDYTLVIYNYGNADGLLVSVEDLAPASLDHVPESLVAYDIISGTYCAPLCSNVSAYLSEDDQTCCVEYNDEYGFAVNYTRIPPGRTIQIEMSYVVSSPFRGCPEFGIEHGAAISGENLDFMEVYSEVAAVNADVEGLVAFSRTCDLEEAIPGEPLECTVHLYPYGTQAGVNALYTHIVDEAVVLLEDSVVASCSAAVCNATVVSVSDSQFAVSFSPYIGFEPEFANVTYTVVPVCPFPARSVTELGAIALDCNVTETFPLAAEFETPVTPSALGGEVSATVVSDCNDDGLAGPGDTVRFAVRVSNFGVQTVEGLPVVALVDPLAELVSGSVYVCDADGSRVVAGNAHNDGRNRTEVVLGRLSGSGCGSVLSGEGHFVFSARIVSPFPAVQDYVLEQLVSFPAGAVGGNVELAGLVAVHARPELSLSSESAVVSDADGSGGLSAGDVFEVRLVLVNSGDQDDVVVLSDTVAEQIGDAKVEDLVDGPFAYILPDSVSVSLTDCDVCETSVREASLEVTAYLPGNDGELVVSYQVAMADALPYYVTGFTNDANATGTIEAGRDGAAAAAPLALAPSGVVITATKTTLAESPVVPGELVPYSVLVTSSGTETARDVVVRDDIAGPHALVNGTVLVDPPACGRVEVSDAELLVVRAAGLPCVTADGVYRTVNISFATEVFYPFPVGLDEIVNQAIVTGENFPTLLTGDGSTVIDRPTTLAVEAAAELVVEKSLAALPCATASPDGPVLPGDTLGYNVSVWNTGNQDADLIVTDTILSDCAELVPDSVSLTLPANATGEALDPAELGLPPENTLAARVNSLPGTGEPAQLSYCVQICYPYPADAPSLSNQVEVDCLTCSLSEGTDGSGTATTVLVIDPVPEGVVLGASQEQDLLVDVNQNGLVTVFDDLIMETTSVGNIGDLDAGEVVVLISADRDVTFAGGDEAVFVSTGAVLSASGTEIVVAAGDLTGDGQEVFLVTYFFYLNNNFPFGKDTIVNSVNITGSNFEAQYFDAANNTRNFGDIDFGAQRDIEVASTTTSPASILAGSCLLLLGTLAAVFFH